MKYDIVYVWRLNQDNEINKIPMLILQTPSRIIYYILL